MDSANGSSLVGIQRNRQSADLLEFRDHGKDVLALQKPAFELARGCPSRSFCRLQCLLCRGTRRCFLCKSFAKHAARLLYRINEIMPLPVAPMQVGLRMELRHLWTSDEA